MLIEVACWFDHCSEELNRINLTYSSNWAILEAHHNLKLTINIWPMLTSDWVYNWPLSTSACYNWKVKWKNDIDSLRKKNEIWALPFLWTLKKMKYSNSVSKSATDRQHSSVARNLFVKNTSFTVLKSSKLFCF